MVSEKKEVRAYFCPRCRSVDVKYIFGLGNIFGIIPRQKCMRCEFSSSVFPILVLDNKSLNKKKKLKRVNGEKRK